MPIDDTGGDIMKEMMYFYRASIPRARPSAMPYHMPPILGQSKRVGRDGVVSGLLPSHLLGDNAAPPRLFSTTADRRRSGRFRDAQARCLGAQLTSEGAQHGLIVKFFQNFYISY